MLLKLLFKWSINFVGQPKQSTVKDSDKPRILIIPYNAIGDMVMTAPLFSALKQAHPEWQLEVLCSSRNHEIIRYHPALSRCWLLDIDLKPQRAFSQHRLRQELYEQQFDKVVYLGERRNWIELWRIHRMKANQKVSLPYSDEARQKQKKKLDPFALNIFNGVVGKNKHQVPHFTRRMMSILPDFGVQQPEKLAFNLNLPHVADKGHSLPQGIRLLFNPCGSQTGNTLSDEQAVSILDGLLSLGIQVCVFDLPENRAKLAAYGHDERVNYIRSASISDAGDWLRDMSLVLTTDTSMGHIASALDVRTLIMRANEEWRANCDPISEFASMLVAKTHGHIQTISADLVMNEVKMLLQTLPQAK